MKLDCATVENAIWDRAEGGPELTEAALRHIERCSSCAQAMGEVRAGLAALDCARAYPSAPDCRPRVAERIERLRSANPRLRYAWAAAVIVVAALLVIYCPRTTRNVTNVVTVKRPARGVAVKPQLSLLDRREPVQVKLPPIPQPASEPVKPRVARVPGIKHTRTVRRQPVEHQHSDVVGEPESERDDAVAQQPDENRVVHAVSVNWQANRDPNEVSYQYSETDPSTGTVTEGSVVRRGNSIEIRLESTPATQTPPIRGETNNETNPSA